MIPIERKCETKSIEFQKIHLSVQRKYIENFSLYGSITFGFLRIRFNVIIVQIDINIHFNLIVKNIKLNVPIYL